MALPLLGRREAQVPSVQDAAPIATTPTPTMFHMEGLGAESLTARFEAVAAWVESTTSGSQVSYLHIHLVTGDLIKLRRTSGDPSFTSFTDLMKEHFADAFSATFLGQVSGEPASSSSPDALPFTPSDRNTYAIHARMSASSLWYVRADHIMAWTTLPEGTKAYLRGHHTLTHIPNASLVHLAATLIVKP